MNALTLFARLMAEAGEPKRRHKRNFYEALSTNVNYFDQGQPWLRKDTADDDDYEYEYDDYGYDD